jgi:lipoyl(octanoyl) transferase
MTEFKTSPVPIEYEEALAFMDSRVQGISDGLEDECVWLLEHPSLYTAGTSAKESDLLNARFPVYTAGRGGQYTYHGPGQRIAYVMMDLRKHQKAPDIKAYVWFLEEWIIRSLAEFGITGKRICGRVGIWVETDGGEKKIAALGVRVRRWVTLHGIAINVNPDLSHFAGIVPCGIADAGVTSMAALGADADMAALDRVLKETFGSIPLIHREQQCR